MTDDRPATTDQQPKVYGPAAASAALAAFARLGSQLAAARASEAPGDVYGPAPDVGAAQGGEGGSAAESELRAHLAEAFRQAAYQHEPICDEDGCECDVWLDSDYGDTISVSGKVDALAEIAAAVIPAIRAQVADEIETTIGGYPENGAVRPRFERGGYLNDVDWAAAIARGDQ